MERVTTRSALQRQPKLLLSSSHPPYTKLLYTPEEAAELLSMSRSRLYILLARAVIASIKEGRARLIPAVALDQYVQRRLEEQAVPVVVVEPVEVLYARRRQA
jgi:excisionase family DNA binding protein